MGRTVEDRLKRRSSTCTDEKFIQLGTMLRKLVDPTVRTEHLST
jgi:hypothetical protein